MDEGMKPEGYVPQFFQPITSAIPYFYRWKLSQAKLLLNDLAYLQDKHDIAWAGILYARVAKEVDRMCARMAALIQNAREKREKYEQEEEAVQRNE